MKGNEKVEEIVCMTYEQWEELHIQRARMEARSRQRRWREKHEADRKKREYFCMQRFIGGLIAAASLVVFLAFRVPGMILGSMGIIVGLYMAITKKMVIVNDYWFENGGADQWK